VKLLGVLLAAYPGKHLWTRPLI